MKIYGLLSNQNKNAYDGKEEDQLPKEDHYHATPIIINEDCTVEGEKNTKKESISQNDV